MLNVPGIDPKRIECEVEEGGRRRVRLDYCTVAFIDKTGFCFDGNWSDQLAIKAKDVLKVVIAEWLASDGTRLWPDPPPDLLAVTKEVLSNCYSLLTADDRQRLEDAVAAEEAKRAAAKPETTNPRPR